MELSFTDSRFLWNAHIWNIWM